jgi:hypothetical protein
MADQLATPSDLASALQQDVDTSTATLLIECATAVVQEAAGQRIVQVVGDVQTLLGTTDSWLDLPQIPVTAVTSVVRDGVTLTLGTDYKVFGARLWSRNGWQANYGYYGGDWRPSYGDSWLGPEPGTIVVTNTHGYAPGSQELQLARNAVISLAAKAYSSPTPGVSSESIDDYTIQYAVSSAAASSALDASPYLKSALRKQYGRRGGLVRIG